ncbi:MAG: hypothetical protein FJW23_09785, partial [Acidimicrobiia bacterium]|nr:hypothetical protein [Acidimicrobiia bacterium]
MRARFMQRDFMGWSCRRRRAVVVPAVAALLLGVGAAARAQTATVRGDGGSVGEAMTAASSRALLDRYCVTCHNERRRVGNLALDAISLERVAAGAETWEKVIKKLRTGAMPPPGLPPPPSPRAQGLAAWLETSIDAAAAKSP